MRAKLPTWAKGLTKKEVEHLKQEKMFTQAKAVESAEFQESLPHTSRCWVCVSIGHKIQPKQEAGV